MRALIVHCHPESQSFNGSLTSIAAATLRRQGWTVEVSDLYAEHFNPVEGPEHYAARQDPAVFSPLGEQRHAGKSGTLPPDVRREISRLERADLVILQFPLWWHAQPAMLKGWFDRVFVSGLLYTSRMRYDAGIFRGKRAICSVTAGAPEAAFGPLGRGGDIERLMWPIHYSLHYMGFSVLPPNLVYGVQGHGYAYRDDAAADRHLKGALDTWAGRLETLDAADPLSFPGWEDWDAEGRHLKEFA